MIARFPMGQKNLSVKAIALSCLCHFSLFGLFIFTISPPQAQAKPLMIFLGSILRKHDVTYTASAPAKKAGDMDPSVSYEPIQNSPTGTLISFSSSAKPPSSGKLEAAPKQSFKPPMEYAPLPKKGGEKSPANDTQSPIPPYRPLKWETK